MFSMKSLLSLCFSLIITSVFAQNKTTQNWKNLDPAADKIYGAGTEQAYKLLKGKAHKTVIVAVIDIGTDIEHEDLKDVIWTNPGEIPGNGIDDDKNGYVDDIHGWNFLGGKNAEINYEATEDARQYHKLKKKYSSADSSQMNPEELKKYREYLQIKKEFLTSSLENDEQLRTLTMLSDFFEKVKKQNNGQFNKEGLKNFKPETDVDKQLQRGLKLAITFGLKPQEMESELTKGTEALSNLVKYNKINTDSIRRVVVGDNPDDISERYYGNNNVAGPDPLHGTHVAGIIGAIRDNNKGMNGMADDVRLMIIRAVPNGDERDKDIANAIRYAVDNGAKVINMSFGKYHSPDKEVVDDAIRYAMSKDVVLVHGAGNESKNEDAEGSFPSRKLNDGTIASNWLEVGANSMTAGKGMLAPFSNYGKTTVDFFAPGVDIYSSVPAPVLYVNESGTSMASPSVAGVVALIREYFPEMNAQQICEVLKKTVTPYSSKVNVPGLTKKGLFRKKPVKKHLNELCISGGFVNVNNAVKLLLAKK